MLRKLRFLMTANTYHTRGNFEITGAFQRTNLAEPGFNAAENQVDERNGLFSSIEIHILDCPWSARDLPQDARSASHMTPETDGAITMRTSSRLWTFFPKTPPPHKSTSGSGLCFRAACRAEKPRLKLQRAILPDSIGVSHSGIT
jgi:hypothetical protein